MKGLDVRKAHSALLDKGCIRAVMGDDALSLASCQDKHETHGICLGAAVRVGVSWESPLRIFNRVKAPISTAVGQRHGRLARPRHTCMTSHIPPPKFAWEGSSHLAVARHHFGCFGEARNGRFHGLARVGGRSCPAPPDSALRAWLSTSIGVPSPPPLPTRCLLSSVLQSGDSPTQFSSVVFVCNLSLGSCGAVRFWEVLSPSRHTTRRLRQGRGECSPPGHREMMIHAWFPWHWHRRHRCGHRALCPKDTLAQIPGHTGHTPRSGGVGGQGVCICV